MKIPLDFFLRLMQRFLNDIELNELADAFNDYVEVEEDDYADLLKGVSFKEIINSYINTNAKLKKKIKAKVKALEAPIKEEEDNEDAEVNDEDEDDGNDKKRLNKKTKRHYKDNDDEEDDKETDNKPIKPKKTDSKRNNNKANKKQEENEDEEEDIDLTKLEFKPCPKANLNPERKPFQRIDDSIKETIPEALKDNSYEAFMKKTGDNFGQDANNKLKFTKGKDFKKEKGKFKNKSSAGTYAISTTVRSIPLDDSD